jgi:hypothetical protein
VPSGSPKSAIVVGSSTTSSVATQPSTTPAPSFELVHCSKRAAANETVHRIGNFIPSSSVVAPRGQISRALAVPCPGSRSGKLDGGLDTTKMDAIRGTCLSVCGSGRSRKRCSRERGQERRWGFVEKSQIGVVVRRSSQSQDPSGRTSSTCRTCSRSRRDLNSGFDIGTVGWTSNGAAPDVSKAQRRRYDEVRPHSSLGDLGPNEFKAIQLTPLNPTGTAVL